MTLWSALSPLSHPSQDILSSVFNSTRSFLQTFQKHVFNLRFSLTTSLPTTHPPWHTSSVFTIEVQHTSIFSLPWNLELLINNILHFKSRSFYLMFVLPILSFVSFYNLVHCNTSCLLITYCDLLTPELWISLYPLCGTGASKLSHFCKWSFIGTQPCLFAYISPMAASTLQWQSWVVATETEWPTRFDIFTIKEVTA